MFANLVRRNDAIAPHAVHQKCTSLNMKALASSASKQTCAAGSNGVAHLSMIPLITGDFCQMLP